MLKNQNKNLKKNSIYDNTESQDYENEVKLILNSDLDINVMIVEGITDYKFWRKFINKDCVEILNVNMGKGKVTKIIKNVQNKRLLGIQDRDYYEGKEPDRIFFYDYNCLEIMLINSEKVFNSLYAEYYLGNKKKEDLKTDVFKQLKYISIIRQHSYKNKWGINLNNIINDCCIKNCIDIDKLINEVEKRNVEKNIDEKKHIFDNEFSKTWNISQYLNLTRGHDYIKLLSIICNNDIKKLATKSRLNKADEIESVARASFDLKELKKTKIFSSLSEYEQKQNLTIFIRE